MAYASWSVVFGEQPSASKWNILGTNDASFNDGTGIADDAITGEKIDSASIIYATSTPGGNSDSTGSWADWGASVNISVPTWANRAVVVTTLVNIYCVTSATTGFARTVIGSNTGTSSGLFGRNAAASADTTSVSWVDQITLTGTGTVALKAQVIENSGTGALRVDGNSDFTWLIVFLKS